MWEMKIELRHCESVHHLPPHLAGVVLLPPGVGGDEDLQGGVEEPETAVELLPISPFGSRLSEIKNQNTSQELQTAYGQDNPNCMRPSHVPVGELLFIIIHHTLRKHLPWSVLALLCSPR